MNIVGDPGAVLLTPESGMGKDSVSGCGTVFGLKYLNSLIWIRDPGWKKFLSGMEKIWIRYPG
jgi:hypothetical protein